VFAYFLEAALPLGLVWEAGAAEGAAVWTPPERREAWNQLLILALAGDGGRRYGTFWDWSVSTILRRVVGAGLDRGRAGAPRARD
jgi:hypothetical protein